MGPADGHGQPRYGEGAAQGKEPRAAMAFLLPDGGGVRSGNRQPQRCRQPAQSAAGLQKGSRLQRLPGEPVGAVARRSFLPPPLSCDGGGRKRRQGSAPSERLRSTNRRSRAARSLFLRPYGLYSANRPAGSPPRGVARSAPRDDAGSRTIFSSGRRSRMSNPV